MAKIVVGTKRNRHIFLFISIVQHDPAATTVNVRWRQTEEVCYAYACFLHLALIAKIFMAYYDFLLGGKVEDP